MRKIYDIQYGYLSLDKLDDLIPEDMYYHRRRNKLVVVKLQENQFLVFLVEDVEKPSVPGYPACSIEYFSSHKEALEKINQIYEKFNYKPNYPAEGFYSKWFIKYFII